MAKQPRRIPGNTSGTEQPATSHAGDLATSAQAASRDLASPADSLSVSESQSGLVNDEAASVANSLVEQVGIIIDTETVPMEVFEGCLTAAVNLELSLNSWRETFASLFRNHDNPNPMQVGRVVYVLTIHRRDLPGGSSSCGAGDVLLVFLSEIPEETDYENGGREYRVREGQGTKGTGWNLEDTPARKGIYRNLRALVAGKVCEKRQSDSRGRDKQFFLTQSGEILFDGWPVMAGLRLIPPALEGN